MWKFREMTEEDIPEVFRINKENFTTDAWSMEGFEREFKLPYSKRFVVEMDGKVVAYLIFWIIGDEAHLMTFGVDKTHWGKGIGKMFLKEALIKLKGDVRRVLLDVRKSNIRAIRLYQSLNFHIVGERRYYYSDGESAIQMEYSFDTP
ncbi:ribosomal protein S18-alanine N-acetyltransferase [Thermocrinis sp.]